MLFRDAGGGEAGDHRSFRGGDRRNMRSSGFGGFAIEVGGAMHARHSLPVALRRCALTR